MKQDFFLHVKTFESWLNNFELITFDSDEEDQKELFELLDKLVKNEPIDEQKLELLYALALDNANFSTNELIKKQAKEIIDFLNSHILQNITRE